MINAAAKSDKQKEAWKLNNKQQSCSNELFECEFKRQVLELQDSESMNIKCNPEMTNKLEKDLELCCQPSTSRIQNQQAICIRSACKRYGSKTDPVVVLDKLDMSVPKGVIYGLLGASGCGKTTLLNCIVGRKKLNFGEIWVLNGTPGSKSCGVPGPRVGYMPQGTALYGDFTIRETLVFFGWIAGMTSEKIQKKVEFLLKLLMLPNANQRVKTLSGGQQRRVSLATALLHEPELLILDEPTVGLDSVLRDNIWCYLLDITREQRTTVVITTHYIDEARKAHLVALMRGGHFLVEESPNGLLKQHGLETLEELFFKLSRIQESSNSQLPTKQNGIGEIEFPDTYTDNGANISSLSKAPLKAKVATESSNYLVYRRSHMKALFWKNFLWMVRNFHITLFVVMSPVVVMSFLCICIGNIPADLSIAIVNYETNNIMTCEDKLTCDNSQLSCYYLKYLEKHNVTLVPYDSAYGARESVLKGTTYASIVVKNNYSSALHSRVQDWQYATDWDILSSEIDVFQDVSSKIIANYIKALLCDTYVSFLRDYLASCNIDSKWSTSAMNVSVVYGRRDSTFTDFVIPGILLMYIFMMSAAVAVVIMMIERSEGLLERILVSGITKIELLTSHLICELVIMVLLTTMALICVFVIFNKTTNGSFLLIVILSLLTGFCGLCYGLCISCASDRMAFHVVGGSLLPTALLSGMIWPIEGMHYLLQPFAYFLPLTYATESMRSIMYRGWGISAAAVYLGFIWISIWTTTFLIIIILMVKFKKD